jgi:hypothetical protein
VKALLISLVSIDHDNTAIISFSKEMQIFSVSTEDLSVVITGPANKYRLTYSASFLSPTQLQVKVNSKDIIFGDSNEVMTITLSKSKFISMNGEPIYNNEVKGHPHQIVDNSEFISAAGTATSSILAMTMGVIISSNVLL